MHYQDSFGLRELLEKLEEIIQGLLHSLSQEDMRLIYHSFTQLNNNQNPGFTMLTLPNRSMTKEISLLWDLVVVGKSGKSPRFFTRKSGTRNPFSLKTDPGDIQKLTRQITMTSQQVPEQDLLSNNSIQSINSRRTSRGGSARSIGSGSIHYHHHAHPPAQQVDPQAGTSASHQQQAFLNQQAANNNNLQHALQLSQLDMAQGSNIQAQYKSPVSPPGPNTQTSA